MQNDLIASEEFQISGFFPDKTKLYVISIQLRLNGFSFMLVESSTDKLVKIQDWKYTSKGILSISEKWQLASRHIDEVWNRSEYFGLNFTRIIVTVDHIDYQLIPQVFYDTNDPKRKFEFSKEITYPFRVKEKIILGSDRMITFAFPVAMENWLDENFENCHITHSCAIFQNEILKLHKNKLFGSRIYVHNSAGFMHIMAMRNEDFVFMNSFQFQTKEEFVYFILLTYSQLQFNPEENPLFLLGDINSSTALYKIVYQYIRNIEFLDKINGVKLSFEFDNLSLHQNYLLLQTLVCE